MTHWPGLRRVFRLPTSDARMRADVDAELEFHIQGRIDELVASGATRVYAEREARARFGDYQAIESEVERLERRRHRRRTLRDRLERLRSTPGIIGAGATASLPLKRGLNIPTTVLGHPDLTEGATEWRGVSTDYFRTMDVSLMKGRDFTESDVAGAPRVAIVSNAYVKRFLRGENPIGKRIQIGVYKGQGPDSIASEVIGVVPDLRDQSLESKRYRNTVWTPIAQGDPSGLNVPAFVVHASDAAIAAKALRAAITQADARMGNPDIAAMSDLVTRSLEQRRFTMILLATFAAVALALTCIGIYGVASYSVSQRPARRVPMSSR